MQEYIAVIDGENGERGLQKTRQSRAAYFDQLSARVLKKTARRAGDGAFAELSSLVGEIVTEMHRLEERCAQAEAELAALSRRHHDLLNRVPVPCVLTDASGIVVDANEQALALLRESERRMTGKPLVLWLRDREDAQRFVQAMPTAVTPLHRRMRFAPRDRKAIDVTVVLQEVDGAATPLWRWFLLATGPESA